MAPLALGEALHHQLGDRLDVVGLEMHLTPPRAGADRRRHWPQQQLEEQLGAVLAGDGLGAVEHDHLLAGDRAFDVEAAGMAQHDVDLRGREQPAELVERRVEHLYRAAAVAQQLGELAAPVVAGEVQPGNLVESAEGLFAGGAVAGAEYAEDVQDCRSLLDGADHR